MIKHNFHLSQFSLMKDHSLHCNYEKIIEQVKKNYNLKALKKRNKFFFLALKII